MKTAARTGPPSTTYSRFVIAGLFWQPMLRILSASAITMPWRSIYVIPERFDDETLRQHELVHIEQIERDGVVKFCLLYVWWTARYGYWKNPYEIEAYAREEARPTLRRRPSHKANRTAT